ncbi:MAG TPA: hypothetical protein VHA52_02280 [Candidatus Babeliaceae bacterium]|nr:hypothetical protein [Candidatus Babeliaceae bacterium]
MEINKFLLSLLTIPLLSIDLSFIDKFKWDDELFEEIDERHNCRYFFWVDNCHSDNNGG